MTTNYKLQITNYNRGAAVIIVVMFFVVISITVALGLSSSNVREYITARDFDKSKGAYYLAEASHEDVLYRIKKLKQYDAVETLTLNGNTATTTITTIDSSNKLINSIGDIAQNTRRVKSAVTTGTGASFSLAVQTGNGGIFLSGSSSVTGNIYSNRVVQGTSDPITGSVVSAGPLGSVSGIDAGGSVYSHTISKSTVGGNAYYFSPTTLTSTTVSGTKFPGSADQATSTLPISDAQIEQFEADATAGGVYSSPCIISVPTNWSARELNCTELEIKDTLTISGWIWVKGNVKIKGGTVKLDPTLGANSVGIIADNPRNKTTSSKISLETTTNFQGSGIVGSYFFLISQNNSAELGGTEVAIDLGQSASGDILLYAAHGEVVVGQSSVLKEVTAYKVSLQNSANVTYTSGLTNVLFVGSPSGPWNINDWKEGQ